MLLLFLLFGFFLISLLWINHLNRLLHPGIIALFYPVIGLITVLYVIVTHHDLSTKIAWIPQLDINLSVKMDGLSVIFFLLIAFIGLLVVLYSIFYLSKNEDLSRFYSYLLLFMIAMYGVVISNNTILLYIFWEMTSISSFLLISFWYKKEKSRAGALKSFLITVFGGMMMLVGFISLYVLTGTNEIDGIIERLTKGEDQTLYIFAMCMLLIGALTKSAQFPFHIWLPDAMEAPTPVSAYLHSATMVKAGIYLLLRFLPAFNGEPIFQWVLIIDGLITMLLGSLFAVRQTDLKGLLAYSTISHLGMIISMIGLASILPSDEKSSQLVVFTLTALLLHILNHAVFKAALFMGTGIVDHSAHTRDLSRLGGLRRVLPITFVVMTIGSLAMAGIPLFNGFLSKEMFLTAFDDYRHLNTTIGIWLLLAGFIASIGTFLYSLVLVGRTFFGQRTIDDVDKESTGILVAPSILAFLVIVMFFIPNILLKYLISPAMDSILSIDISQYVKPISAWHGFNVPLLLTVMIILIGSLLYFSGIFKTIFPKRQEMWLNIVYQKILVTLDRVSHVLINRVMTDRLNHYLMFLFGVILIILMPLTVVTLIHTPIKVNLTPLELPVYGVMITLFIACVLTFLLKTKSRMTATVLTGAVGYGVSMFYILLKAPDLALTQLVIETITTVLFLSSFYHLPKIVDERKSKANKLVSASIALGMSLLVMFLMLLAGDMLHFETITRYYENAYELTGGKNIVNAILGDFRAFDTLLEGIVLMITGLGIYVLVHQPKKGGKANERK